MVGARLPLRHPPMGIPATAKRPFAGPARATATVG
jgi:hypothetical protein